MCRLSSVRCSLNDDGSDICKIHILSILPIWMDIRYTMFAFVSCYVGKVFDFNLGVLIDLGLKKNVWEIWYLYFVRRKHNGTLFVWVVGCYVCWWCGFDRRKIPLGYVKCISIPISSSHSQLKFVRSRMELFFFVLSKQRKRWFR